MQMIKQRLHRGYQMLKSMTRGGSRTFAPYSGSVDGLVGENLFGWAVKTGATGDLSLGLFVAEGLLDITTASNQRLDVRDAGFGDGNCGFSFNLSPALLSAIAKGGGQVTVRSLDSSDYCIGRFNFPASAFEGNDEILSEPTQSFSPISDPTLEKCRSRLFGDLACFRSQLEKTPEKPDLPDPGPPVIKMLHDKLFEKKSYGMNTVGSGEPACKLPAYIDYMKLRMRVDKFLDLDTEGNSDDYAHALNWYVSDYGSLRAGLRIPLSREVIDYLNEPVIIGGQRYSISRIMWWQIAKSPVQKHNLNLSDFGRYLEILFWWANTEAKRIHVEDCLIPQNYVDILAMVNQARKHDKYPMSAFMDRFFRENTQFHFLNGTRENDRKIFTMSMILMSVKRPDLLGYIPAASLREVFKASANGRSDFEEFYNTLAQNDVFNPVSYERFSAILRHQGYDLYSQSFLTINPDGNRYEAAALAPVESDEPVDVQMIGPFEKASGLGQATRLSAAIMGQTSLKTNSVNFGFDNPAPEGFSNVGEISEYKNAKINLIQLNAESIPLVFAYEPDVFNGSYNIGYFYWELNTPANCHYLAMELLDEIWVASEYGVSIYKPETEIPVTNVGMCIENLPDIDRKSSRDFVNRRFRFDDAKFVFLVAFDFFSFVQRKNPVAVLEAFQKAFSGIKDVRLVIKTQNRDDVVDPVKTRIWNKLQSIIASDRRIQVLNETLSYKDLIKLKQGSDCYISLHRSEGWGFGMIEAMNLKVPVICTAYSGNMEFCNDKTTWLVDYKEVELRDEDYIFVRQGQKWAEPSVTDAAKQMLAVYSDDLARKQKVDAAYHNITINFSAKAIATRYEARLREILDGLD
ncbi:MAG TPA: hypothetical protein DD729_03395 [Rhodobacteraceae bacterium]|jgi:glycosyltransferase involved in cell wall biosynthesis|nr:hypothetical protein [Paracoccaceae bacterium]